MIFFTSLYAKNIDNYLTNHIQPLILIFLINKQKGDARKNKKLTTTIAIEKESAKIVEVILFLLT